MLKGFCCSGHISDFVFLLFDKRLILNEILFLINYLLISFLFLL
jgi:hypothetical protein